MSPFERGITRVAVGYAPFKEDGSGRAYHSAAQICAVNFFLVQRCVQEEHGFVVTQYVTTTLSEAQSVEARLRNSEWNRIVEVQPSIDSQNISFKIIERAPSNRETSVARLREYLNKYFWPRTANATDDGHVEPG